MGNKGFQLHGHIFDVFFNLCHTGCLPYLFFGGIFVRACNVEKDVSLDQIPILNDHPKLLSHLGNI